MQAPPLTTVDALLDRYEALLLDASRLPESVTARFAALGLPVPAERIITSGSLLAPFFTGHDLAGRATAVLGPEDSVAYVRQAGGEPVPTEDRSEVLVTADERGQPFPGACRIQDESAAEAGQRPILPILLVK